jgi:hypothetical protein
MKKYLFLSLFAALLLASCSDKEIGPVLSLGNAPSISSPADGASFVLTEATADSLFAGFSWTAAEYGFNAGVTYTLEMDVNGNNFADAVAVASANTLMVDDLLNSKINTIMLTKGLPGEVEANMDFRVKAEISDEIDPVYSNPITLKITPYTVVIVYPQLQVPGAYQGWDPSNNNTVIYSASSNGMFEGYIYFTDPNTEFKFTDGPAWDVNYGDTGADGTLDQGGDNILVADPGMYKLNVNLNALTYTVTKTDWGLIGSATPGGWDFDQDMTYDAANNKLTITLDLVAGEVKFRANDDWALNLGDDGADFKLEYGTANIAIPEDGNYTIDLILSGAIYTYTVTKN